MKAISTRLAVDGPWRAVARAARVFRSAGGSVGRAGTGIGRAVGRTRSGSPGGSAGRPRFGDAGGSASNSGNDGSDGSTGDDTVEGTGGFGGPGGDPFDRLPVDPIGVGIVLVIVLVAGGLLLVGPLSGLFDGTPGTPETEWDHVRVNDTHVQLAHVGGDDVEADRLEVTVDGDPRSPNWPATVTEGTVVIVEADPDSTVVIAWTGGERRQLARFTV